MYNIIFFTERIDTALSVIASFSYQDDTRKNGIQWVCDNQWIFWFICIVTSKRIIDTNQIRGLLDKTRSRSLARILMRPLIDPLMLSSILGQISNLKDPVQNPTASMVTLTVIKLQLIAFHKSVMLYKPYSGTVRSILCNPEERFGQLFCLSHQQFKKSMNNFTSPDDVSKLRIIVKEMLHRFSSHFQDIHTDVANYVKKHSVGSYSQFNEEYSDAIREVQSVIQLAESN